MVSTSLIGRAIFEYSTEELIDELSRREGVGRTDVAADLQYVEVHVIVRDKINRGLSQSIIHKFFRPSIILAIEN